ncbi:MAG: peptidyl-prolyl cis-trans isomerase, partial [Pseudomonadota bacterium]
PSSVARRYTALLRERREGTIALLPSTAYAPADDVEPSEQELASFYEENRGRYIQPERRTIRYATFSDENLNTRIEPTAAEITARYERDSAQYAAQETRTISSFFVPTEDAAMAIRDQVRSGTSLEAAAQAAGFSVTSNQGQSESQLASATSSAVAEAVFAASEGQLAEPARSALGWYIARVDDVVRTPARSLAEATPEITEQLTVEKRAAALSDFSARIEEQVDSGTSLSDVAEEFGLTLQTTPQLLADGRVFGQDGAAVAPELRSTLETAFDMEESEPQLAEVVRGQIFVAFEVEEITPSAASPMAEIRDRVEFDWRLFSGSDKAREAAERILERMRGEGSLAEAVREEEVNLPPVEQINLDRTELLSQQQRVAPPLALLFSMAEGTTKPLEAANRLGWFVVDLQEIATDEVADDDPLFQATRTQLGPAISNEYAEQLTNAMREELVVDRNEDAIEAVRKQLAGET